MKNIKYILLALPLMFMTTSCEDFLDINRDPDNPTNLTLDQALPPILFYAAQLVYDHSEYGAYLAQMITTTGNSQIGSYPYRQGWDFININRHPQWRRHFFDIGMNNKRMIDMAQEQGARNYELIGRTIRLMSTMLTTDAFGDMPHEQAWEYTTPRFDTQASIYNWMFEEAEYLVQRFGDPAWVNSPRNLPITRSIDRIYGGDMGRWGAFAKALRARLWLRKLPNWDNTPETANRIVAYARAALEDPNWQEPRYYYPGVGPEESVNPWGPARPRLNNWERRQNALNTAIPTTFFMHGILGAYRVPNTNRMFALDPRATQLMTPRTLPTGGGAGIHDMAPSLSTAMRHLESNFGMDPTMRVTNFPDFHAPLGYNPFTRNDGYIALMLHEELLFIKAEAQYWAGERVLAYETTRRATLYNMQRLRVITSDDGSCLHGSQFPPGHPGYRNTPRERFDRFFEVRLNAGSFTIAHLMQQKYVAMFLQPEQWTDMRRYNFSSASNGIRYETPTGVHEVYTVRGIHSGVGTLFNYADFWNHPAATSTYSLRRPFNLFTSWMSETDFGNSVPLSPNAWVHRINYDPETEERYNARELERLGAFRDRDWLRRRMIWAENRSGKAQSADNIPWMYAIVR